MNRDNFALDSTGKHLLAREADGTVQR